MSANADDAPTTSANSVMAALLPIMAVVFAGFLVIGLAMPVLPLYVHEGLGHGPFVVGLVAGSQFAASLVSRLWAGHFADTSGAKRAVVTGLLIAAFSGLLYFGSFYLAHAPFSSVTILIVGRGFLGAAESFIITGALGWGMALCGPQNTEKVIAWIGMAMFGAFALGAPIGSLIYGRYGFVSVALATTLLPLLALFVVAPLRGVAPIGSGSRPAFNKVAAAVTIPGIALAFSSVGFGAITTFIALLFVKQGWGPVWLAFTVLSVAFILCRLFFGYVPDKVGGIKVAFVCVLVETAGQAMIWLAPSSNWALAGVALSGFGYALVYPGYGIEAVRRVAPENRALAMGTFTAFLDLALGVSGPALGLVASSAGFRAVFLASAIIVACSAGMAAWLMVRGANRQTTNTRMEQHC
jgi:MFS family permease